LGAKKAVANEEEKMPKDSGGKAAVLSGIGRRKKGGRACDQQIKKSIREKKRQREKIPGGFAGTGRGSSKPAKARGSHVLQSRIHHQSSQREKR